MNWLLATTNPHKLAELQSVLGERSAGWDTLATLDPQLREALREPAEDADTFELNAIAKAIGYAQQCGRVTVADDSGLEVDALGGRPGVRSARYCGVSGPREQVDLLNNARLLEELGDTPTEQRTARYVCVLAVAWPAELRAQQPVTLRVRGELVGRILRADEAADPSNPHLGRGTAGFGYDPLFVLTGAHPEHAGRTAAELSPAAKDAISHRGAAAAGLLRELSRASHQGWAGARM